MMRQGKKQWMEGRAPQGRCRARGDSGFGLPATMVITTVACAVVGVVLHHSSVTAHQTRMAHDYQRAQIAAESALDYGVMKLRDVIAQYRLSPYVSASELQQVLDTIQPPEPPMAPYAYRSPDGEPAFRITVTTPVTSGLIGEGAIGRGLDGLYQQFTITAGAVNAENGRGVVLEQRVQALLVSVVRYGVFYGVELEIQPGPHMEFHGRVHSNRDMYLGGTLRFFDRVTAHGRIYHRRKDNHERHGEAFASDTQGRMVSMRVGGETPWLDADHPSWLSQSLARWQGQVMDGAHGTSSLLPPISAHDSPRTIIERPLPPEHEAYREETEREKFANKAALYIHVDEDNAVTVTDRWGADVTEFFTPAVPAEAGRDPVSKLPLHEKDDAGGYVLEEPGVYQVLDEAFFDAREQTRMSPVDLYLDQLLESFPQLYDGTYSTVDGRGIVYVTRDLPPEAPGRPLPCVRLRNGSDILPFMGISIVSDLPVYVEGDFNTALGSKPVLVAGDAVTLLSKAWEDAHSMKAPAPGRRQAEDTHYNLVVMGGNVETVGSHYSGGLENVIRFLEHWQANNKTVTFRGSIITLWNSQVATGPWYYNNGPSDIPAHRFRYTAPRRDWGYDPIYQSQNPPGMTMVMGMEEVAWRRLRWEDVTW